LGKHGTENLNIGVPTFSPKMEQSEAIYKS